MQVLGYDDPTGRKAPGRCLVHPHVFGRRLGVVFFELPGHPGPSLTAASAAAATAYLRLIPGRDPDEVLWLAAWPFAGRFPVAAVRYWWFLGQARGPLWLDTPGRWRRPCAACGEGTAARRSPAPSPLPRSGPGRLSADGRT